MNNPLFSVLIANYNNGKYLMGAINSVRKQNYSNWEIIIVDDGSSDNSDELYKTLEHDKHIFVFKNESNKGIAFTKRRTIEEAHGKYLAFLDPDDELMPNALSDHALVYAKNESVSIIFSRHYLCDEKLNIISISRLLSLNENECYFTHKDFRAEHLVSINKEFYYKSCGIDTIYKLAVDTNINFIMEEVGNLYCLDTICYKYRYNLKNQATSNYARHMFWNMLVQYDTCKRRGINVEAQISEWFEDTITFMSKKQVFDKEMEVRNSIAYKIGNALLKPIKLIKSIIKK